MALFAERFTCMKISCISIHAADSADKPIQKVKHLWVESSMWIVYCQSHTLYIQIRHGKEVANYHRDFQSNVIDIIPLLQSKCWYFTAGAASLIWLNLYRNSVRICNQSSRE